MRLGVGTDAYLGSPGRDSVTADDEGGGVSDTDTVATGAGWDFVRTGAQGQPVDDVIDLGADNDVLHTPASRRGRSDAGTGGNRFILDDVGCRGASTRPPSAW